MMLFDFTNVQSLDDWREVSDTVRTVGKSKAVLTLQTSQLFQRAVFFTLLNPQPNGAGFAGIRKAVPISDNEFFTITLPLKDFKSYYRGREIPDGEPLDTANITTFEFQIYGGVYSPIKQHGVSALEIETVSVSS
ncbi:hypothetical protein EAG_03774 [Camponotus floridanus]|uniref:NADH:ubiquinone oxidoreductase intermediate-associated protein 30 domain-containing protein n=1 Tax=Camponotus floridanus TaxID=104421 RepID=E2APK8_CAMFO|nr:hypothetical protein EAG_03774 [Camponotus floridanus]